MQRPEAKNPPKRPSISAETGNLKMGVKNPRRNGLFAVDVEICGFGRLDGRRSGPNWLPPTQVSNQVSESRVRNGIFCCRDRAAKWAHSPRLKEQDRKGPLI